MYLFPQQLSFFFFAKQSMFKSIKDAKLISEVERGKEGHSSSRSSFLI